MLGVGGSVRREPAQFVRARLPRCVRSAVRCPLSRGPLPRCFLYPARRLPPLFSVRCPPSAVRRPLCSVPRAPPAVTPRCVLSAVRRPLCAVHRPLCAVHRPLCAVRRPLCAVHRPLCAVHRPLCAVHRPLCAVRCLRSAVRRPPSRGPLPRCVRFAVRCPRFAVLRFAVRRPLPRCFLYPARRLPPLFSVRRPLCAVRCPAVRCPAVFGPPSAVSLPYAPSSCFEGGWKAFPRTARRRGVTMRWGPSRGPASREVER